MEIYRESHYALCESKEVGERVLVPRPFLFGMQPRNYFRHYSEKIVMKNLRKRCLQYLLDEPILVCALPSESNNGDINDDLLMLAILDGHHRARYSGRFPEIQDIPSVVLSVTQARTLKNNDRVFMANRKKPFESDEEFIEWAMDGVRASLTSFSMVMYEPSGGLVSVARFQKFQHFS